MSKCVNIGTTLVTLACPYITRNALFYFVKLLSDSLIQTTLNFISLFSWNSELHYNVLWETSSCYHLDILCSFVRRRLKGNICVSFGSFLSKNKKCFTELLYFVISLQIPDFHSRRRKTFLTYFP